MKFLIIGGDAAGMSAASRAKRNMPSLDVTVLEQTLDVSYSACGMPYNIADIKRDMDDLIVRKAFVFREKQNIDLKTGFRAQLIDPDKKEVKGVTSENKSFCLSYDKLLIATGASPLIPELPGFNLPGVMALKSLEDGRKIKAYLKKAVKKVIIIGMGYIALELAESFRTLGIDVDMVKPRPILFPWLSTELSQKVQHELVSNNVALYPGYKIKGLEQKSGQLAVVCENLELLGDMVVVAYGITPNSDIAKQAGLMLGPSDTISVNEYMQTSNKDIFAAGDCADAYHIVTDKRVWVPLALWANRGGWAVADNVMGGRTKLKGIVGTSVVKVFDLEVARTGISLQEAKKENFNAVEVTIKSRTRAHAHPGASEMAVSMVGDKKTGRLLGVQIVSNEGAAHRINAPAVALNGNMTVEEFGQSDMAYAPPFSPVWDPMLTAANQLLKKF